MTFDKDKFLEEMYMTFSKSLYIAAIKRVKDHHKAEELVQDTFTIATLNVNKLKNHPNKAGWLYRVLDFCIKKDFYKDYIKRDDSFILKFTPSADIDDMLLSYKEDFFTGELFEEFKDILSEKEINFLLYKFRDDRDITDISTKMGMSYTAVTSFSSRLMKKIKKFLGNM